MYMEHCKEIKTERASLCRRFRKWLNRRKLRSSLAPLRRHFKRSYEKNKTAVGFPAADFDKVMELGTGRYSRVDLVRNKSTGRLSALKVIRMSSILNERGMEHLLSEKRITSATQHPFIVELRNHFKDDRRIYLEMAYYPGGDLLSYLNKNGKCSDELARFYAAQLVMAVDFLHGLGVVHRDLKPDNIMIDADGYLRLIDMGFAKKVDNARMNSLCGTREYLAPELCLIIFRGEGSYDACVDWWALGVVMFHAVTGSKLFDSGNDDSFRDIAVGNIRYPSNLGFKARMFLEALLQTDVDRRLGCGRKGAREITKHAWFEGLDWPALLAKELKAPYMPEVSDVTSVAESSDFVTEDPAYEGGFDFTQF